MRDCWSLRASPAVLGRAPSGGTVDLCDCRFHPFDQLERFPLYQKPCSSGSLQPRPAISADSIVAEIEQDVEFLPTFRPNVEWQAGPILNEFGTRHRAASHAGPRQAPFRVRRNPWSPFHSCRPATPRGFAVPLCPGYSSQAGFLLPLPEHAQASHRGYPPPSAFRFSMKVLAAS